MLAEIENTAKTELERANKLIFVKRYEDALSILSELADSFRTYHSLAFLVHLRRIELSIKMDLHRQTRQHYEDRLAEGSITEELARLCLLTVELHGGTPDGHELIRKYRSYLQDFGENSGVYYGLGCALEDIENFDHAIYNFQQSVRLDEEWYPSYFGLSQIYYRLEDDVKGDYYFYLFEKYAPFNLYGNFDTHKSLSEEFLDEDQFEDAQAAITTLSDWWLENKGRCPPEIQIYECIVLAKIAQAKNNPDEEYSQHERAAVVGEQALSDPQISENSLYFIARALEELDTKDLAQRFYQRIVEKEDASIPLLQKIGSQFLSAGELDSAHHLFEKAYEKHPNNEDIRFCRLVVSLRQAEVDIEAYLVDKERVKGLLVDKDSRVELLSLLHRMTTVFEEDPDNLGTLGDLYLKLGNPLKAATFYEKMHAIDHLGLSNTLKFASFLLSYGDQGHALDILNQLAFDKEAHQNEAAEVLWLKARYFLKTERFSEAHQILQEIIRIDPWNIAYILHGVVCLTKIQYPDSDSMIDKSLRSLLADNEAEVNWAEFDRVTSLILSEHKYELAYYRTKTAFLYSNGEPKRLGEVVDMASLFNPAKGTYDLLRLLNTNFDHPDIYLALGRLYKDLGQFESATMWFEQVLLNLPATQESRLSAYLELADCYVWLNRHLNRAIEYARLALDVPGQQHVDRIFTILANAYLKKGEVRQAQTYLDQITTQDRFEVQYLSGLLQYRNGFVKKAKDIWKPLISRTVKGSRNHFLKQDLLKFYFEEEEYFKAHRTAQ